MSSLTSSPGFRAAAMVVRYEESDAVTAPLRRRSRRRARGGSAPRPSACRVRESRRRCPAGFPRDEPDDPGGDAIAVRAPGAFPGSSEKRPLSPSSGYRGNPNPSGCADTVPDTIPIRAGRQYSPLRLISSWPARRPSSATADAARATHARPIRRASSAKSHRSPTGTPSRSSISRTVDASGTGCLIAPRIQFVRDRPVRAPVLRRLANACGFGQHSSR